MSSSTTEVFAAEQASKLLGRLASQIARTLKRHSAKEVHDLRVAIRRFMCVLVVLKPCFPRNESRKIRRKLKKIMAQAGGVRDRDIAVQLIGKVAPSQASPLVRGVRAERDEAAEALTVSLKRWEGRNLFTKWREALEGESSMKEFGADPDRKSTRLNSSHIPLSRMPSSA